MSYKIISIEKGEFNHPDFIGEKIHPTVIDVVMLFPESSNNSLNLGKQESGGFAGTAFSSSDTGVFTPTFDGNGHNKKKKVLDIF